MKNIKIFLLVIVLMSGFNLKSQNINLFYQNNETNSLLLDEENEIALSIANHLSGHFSAYNIQLGYRPFKYLNISGAFFKEYAERKQDFLKGKNRSYSFAIGTNYKINWMGVVFYGKDFENRRVKVEKGINFIANIGCSINRLNAFDTRDSVINHKEINYNSLFLKLGFSYDYNWGKSGVSGILNINRYDNFDFTGNWFTHEETVEVSKHFEKNNIARTWSLNFHNEIGRGTVKLIFGGNYLIYDQLEKLEIEANSENRQIYIGVIINLNKVSNFMKFKKDETS